MSWSPGVSGVGKSTVVGELSKLGYRTVDSDYGGWCVPPGVKEPPVGPVQPDWIWDEERMQRILSSRVGETLFVAGCVENQGVFYPSFEEVVLLTASPEVITERLSSRTTNQYGKKPQELAQILEDQRQFEGRLKEGATLVIDTGVPIEEVVRSVLELIEWDEGSRG